MIEYYTKYIYNLKQNTMHKVEAQKIKNVYGKDQLYLIIGEGENKVIINIGEKTWNAINKLTNPQTKEKKEAIK